MPFTPNRRSFIIASGMTALASTRVLGANDTLRVGVIGAVGSGKQVFQCGMQQRSWTHFRNAVDLIQGGSLGRVTQVRTYWWQNYNQASWKPKPINAQELDWKMWLGGAPDQPFSEEKYY